ncbi:MAG: hypothetical protein IKG47_11785 [Oscillospiraceae bacterium]|nr:hypothetical protein [Oscillospiraceae bacterium]
MKKDASRFSPKGVLFHRTFFTAPYSSQATAPQATKPQTTTTTTTFSLSGITPEFQSAVGNAQEFLDILYDYLYSVYPDVTAGELNGFGKNGQTVSFRITLNNGVVINGKYNTSNKTLDI